MADECLDLATGPIELACHNEASPLLAEIAAVVRVANTKTVIQSLRGVALPWRQSAMNAIAADIDSLVGHSCLGERPVVESENVSDDLDTQLAKHGLHHWTPALKELLELLNGSEEWLEGDHDKPQEQIVRGLDRIAMLSGRARDGAMCELIADLVSWNVAVRKQGQYWNPLEISFKDFVRDSDMTSGWVHNKRNCTEVDVYKWLIMRVGELNELYGP